MPHNVECVFRVPPELEWPVIACSINWSRGVAPATWSITLPARDENDAVIPAVFLDPEVPKEIEGGDSENRVIFTNLFLDASDYSEQIKDESQITLRGKCIRKFWSSRQVVGPWSFNGEYRNAITEPGLSPPSRYPKAFNRTVEQLIGLVFDALGVPDNRAALRGNGWLDITSHQVQSYAKPGTVVNLADDTPPFEIPAGTTAISALQRLQGLYGMEIGVSPNGTIGFQLAETTITDLGPIETAAQQIVGGADDAVEFVSEGTQEDPFPDMMLMYGMPYLIGDKLVCEPVVRNPERAEGNEALYLPLYRVSTLRALGLLVASGGTELKGRDQITDGEPCIRFMMHQRSIARPFMEIEAFPRLHEIAMEAFTLWRVAMPLEDLPIGGAASGGAPSSGPPTVVEENEGYGLKIEREVSSSFPLLRDNNFDPNSSLNPSINSTGASFLPSITVDEAQPHRWLPLADVRVTTDPASPTAAPQFWAVNAVIGKGAKNSQGGESPNWTDVGFDSDFGISATDDPSIEDAVQLGVTVKVVDKFNGVVQTGEPVYGCDGQEGDPYSLHAGQASSKTRSRLLERIDPRNPKFKSAAFDGMWENMEFQEQLNSHWGTPFMLLDIAYHCQSHIDYRDITSTATDEPGGAAKRVDPGMRGAAGVESFQELFLGIGELQPPPVVSREVNRWLNVPMADLQLMCRAHRVATNNGAGADSPDANSFARGGGWRSGNLHGQCRFDDDLLTDAATSPGEFAAATPEQQQEVNDRFSSIREAQDNHIRAARTNADYIKTINAGFRGWHEDFFPGFPGSLAVENASVQCSGPSASATMRIAANSNAHRPLVGSKLARNARALTGSRSISAGQAAAISAAGAAGGGGNIVNGNSRPTAARAVSSGLSPGDGRASSVPQIAGHTSPSMAISDPRDPEWKKKTGGGVDPVWSEVVAVQPNSGAAIKKRIAPYARGYVPGDFADMVVDLVSTDESTAGTSGTDVKRWTHLEGSNPYFGKNVKDRYGSEIVETQGTILKDGEKLPIRNLHMVGPEESKVHGDIAWKVSAFYDRRKLAPGEGVGSGGIVFTPTDELSDKEAAERDRQTLSFEKLTPADINKSGEQAEKEEGGEETEAVPFALDEGENWAGICNIFHEDLQLDPRGNAHVKGNTDKTTNFGVVNVSNMREWLNIQTTPTTGGFSGDFCTLVAKPNQLSINVDLNPLSYHVGIASLAEAVEEIANFSGASIADENARRAHALALCVDKRLRDLVCLLIDTLLDIPDHQDLWAKLVEFDKNSQCCQDPCTEETEEEPEFGDPPDPPPPPPSDAE